MNPFQELVEQRIREADKRGELDNLPGHGQPLALEDDTMVPEELRAGYRLLKNANCLPPELTDHAEIRSLEELLSRIDAGESRADRDTAQRRLRALRQKVAARRSQAPLWTDPAYQDALMERLGDGDKRRE
jgi:hypothetical protein